MAFSSITQSNIAFKRLSGLANTLNSKAVNEESISSTISLSTQTIFAERITQNPTNGYQLNGSNRGVGLYYTDNVIEKVRLPLSILAGTNLGSNNSQGYYATLPSAYTGVIGFSSSTILYGSLGRIQIIPPAFGYGYTVDLLKSDSNPIDALSTINWIFDYYNGILFVQDPPSNFDISANRPAFVECFIYVGRYTSDFLTGATATVAVGIKTLNNFSGATQFILTGNTGTDFNIFSSGGTITVNIPNASSSNTRGLLTSIDFNTFNNKLAQNQNIILSGDVSGSGFTSLTVSLNIVTSGLTVGSATQIPIISYDDKGRIISSSTANLSIPTQGIQRINNLTSFTQTLLTGNTGFDFNIISNFSSHTFNLPTASSTTRGLLSGTDWTRFNNKFNTPTGSTNQYIRGDGSLNLFPTGLSFFVNDVQYINFIRYNGDVTGSGTTAVTLTLNTVTSGRTIGAINQIPIITFDDKGRIISAYTEYIFNESICLTLDDFIYTSLTYSILDYNNCQLVDGEPIIYIYGDVEGSGSTTIFVYLQEITTGKTVGSSNEIPVITYDNKGRITSSYTISITPYTSNNGISLFNNNFELGGTLIKNTIISGNTGFTLNTNYTQIGGDFTTISGRERLEVIGNVISKGLEWTIRTSPANNSWRSVCYGNGLFVAVASTGTGNRVMTSPDGVNWTSRVNSVDNQYLSVCYGNGLFVAVSITGTGDRVMTSPDGITWTIRASAADNSWGSVCYGNGLFVAVASTGTGNRVMTSPDGITWTIRTSAADNDWDSVCYGNGLFVAVAQTGTGNRIMTSSDGVTWTSRVNPVDNSWQSVCYGNGLFVAIAFTGTGNRVMTSPDGITWTIRVSAADNTWITICYGNGLFVVVGQSGTGNRVMTSPDGITWTSRVNPVSNSWYGLCYGNGLFVSVSTTGTGNRVMTSGKQDININPEIRFNDVLNNYVLTSRTLTINSITYDLSQNRTWTISSSTGISNAITSLNNLTSFTQTLLTGNTGNDFQIISSLSSHTFNLPTASSGNSRGLLSGIDWITFNNKLSQNQNIILIGDITGSGITSITTTLNIITTGRTIGSASQIPIITYDNKGRIVSSSSVNVSSYTSNNGITLNGNSFQLGGILIKDTIISGNTGFTLNTNNVQIGGDFSTIAEKERLEVIGNVISKGLEWTIRTSAADNDWFGVCYGNGLFVAVASIGGTNLVMTSPDGINWTSKIVPLNDWNSVCYGNGLFVAVASSGVGNRVMTSPDGITWTSRVSAGDNDWISVCYGNGLFVAVSSNGSVNGVMTSPNGITWTIRASANTNAWVSVCYGNGLFVAVAISGTGNRVMTSLDGINWTIRVSAADNDWTSVCYGNGLFVAVSSNGSGNRVMTSPDGINWTLRVSAASNSWQSVCYGNGLFVAVSITGTGNRVMTSPNGINWTSRLSVADNSWKSVCYGNGLFVTIAYTGIGNRVMTSGKQDINVDPDLFFNLLDSKIIFIQNSNQLVSSTTETSIFTSNVYNSFDIPSSKINVSYFTGNIKFKGIVNLVPSGNLNLKAYLNNTLLIETSSFTLSDYFDGTIGNIPVDGELLFTTVSTGATGTIVPNLKLTIGSMSATANANNFLLLELMPPNNTIVNLTSSQTLSIKATFTQSGNTWTTRMANGTYI